MGSRISSRHIFLWNPRNVPFPQRSIYCSDQFIDVRSHFWSIGVIFELSEPGSLKVSILLALDAEEALLRNYQTKELHHSLQLGEQVPLHILKVDHVDILPIVEPVQRVGRPPRRIVLHKLGPLCRTYENGNYLKTRVIKQSNWRLYGVEVSHDGRRTPTQFSISVAQRTAVYNFWDDGLRSGHSWLSGACSKTLCLQLLLIDNLLAHKRFCWHEPHCISSTHSHCR